jgi:hypothetical protein
MAKTVTEKAQELVDKGFDVRVDDQGELWVYTQVKGAADKAASNVHRVEEVWGKENYQPIPLPGKVQPGRQAIAAQQNYDAAIKTANRDQFDTYRKYLREDAAMDPAFTLKDIPVVGQLLPKEGINLPFGMGNVLKDRQHGASMVHAGRESDKFVQGVLDLKDMAAFALQSIPDRILGTNYADDNYENIQNRKNQELVKDTLYDPLSEESSLSKMSMVLPYVGTNTLLRAPAKVASEATLRTMGKVVDTVDDATRGAAGRLLDRTATLDNPIGRAVNTIKTESIDPRRRMAAQKAATPKYDNPLQIRKATELGTDTIQGAAEGLMHYDMNPFTGASSSFSGSLLAAPLRRFTDRSPDLWPDPAQRDILEWAKDNGYRATPGMETGSQAQQRFEGAMGSDDATSDIMAKLKNDNQRFYNRVAWNAAGLQPKPGESMGEAILRHKNDLRSQYEAIESQTTGRVNGPLRREFETLLNRYVNGTDSQTRDAFDAIAPYIDDMKVFAAPTRGANGRMQKQTFNGTTYQRVRQSMQAEMKKAYNDGDTVKGQALSDLKTLFDKALVEGMSDAGGDAVEGAARVAKWKELNQKFAITDSLINDGSNVFGNFDPNKYQQHLMQNDAFRTITGEGPTAIKDLQKAVKLYNMEKGQANPGLGTDGLRNVDNSGQTSLLMRAMQTPLARSFSPIEDMYMKLYLEGWGPFQPSVKGLLGTTRNPKGTLNDIGVYTRGGMMAAQPHQAIQNFMYGPSDEDKIQQFLELYGPK